jgi:hypothetical protein
VLYPINTTIEIVYICFSFDTITCVWARRAHSPYRDLLRVGRSSDRNPVRARFSFSSRTALGLTQHPVELVQGPLARGKRVKIRAISLLLLLAFVASSRVNIEEYKM